MLICALFCDAAAAAAASSTGTMCPAIHGIGLVPNPYATAGVVTIAGSGTAGYADHATDRFAAQFNAPKYVLFHVATGMLYVSDTGNHRIRSISPFGAVAIVAGSGVAGWAQRWPG